MPQTPGFAKPPSNSGTRPISDTALHTAQTPAPRSPLRAVLQLLQPARSIPAAAQRTTLSPANSVQRLPSQNCNPIPLCARPGPGAPGAVFAPGVFLTEPISHHPPRSLNFWAIINPPKRTP